MCMLNLFNYELKQIHFCADWYILVNDNFSNKLECISFISVLLKSSRRISEGAIGKPGFSHLLVKCLELTHALFHS